MPGEDTELASMFVRIGADTTGLLSAVSGLEDVFGDLGKSIATGLSIAAVAAFGKAAVGAASDAQLATIKFAQALGTIGVSYAQVGESADAYFEKLEKLDGFQRDDLENSTTKLIQMTQNYAVSLKLIAVAADFARGSGKSLEEATLLVGRAYEGNVTSLKRAGLQVNSTTSSMQALALVQKTYSGDGAAYMDTYAGRVTNLANIWHSFEIGFGKVLIGALYMISDLFKGLGEALFLMMEAPFLALTEGINWLRSNVPGMTTIFGDMGDGLEKQFKAHTDSMKKDFADVLNPTGFDAKTKAMANSVNQMAMASAASVDHFGEILKSVAYQGALTFEKDFSGSFKVFENGTFDVLASFGKMIDSMVQKILESSILNLVGLIFGGIPSGGFGILGNLFGGGGGGQKLGPAFADGGVVNKPTVALIGEDGPEAVVPLGSGNTIPIVGSGRSSSGGNSTTTTINNTFNLQVHSAINSLDPGTFRATMQEFANGLKQIGAIS